MQELNVMYVRGNVIISSEHLHILLLPLEISCSTVVTGLVAYSYYGLKPITIFKITYIKI